MSAAPKTSASGVLLVDKPAGLTSHDVVARTRRAIGTRKVGHAGTLDPMATGLLVLGVNSSTRLLTWLVGLDKEYTATIRLGAGSTTDDAQGELGERVDAAALTATTDSAIAAAAKRLTGLIQQRPSSVSAIKVNGKRAYTRVREGEDVVLAERAVTIHAFELAGARRGDWIDVDVRIECSSGTYIRAIARDIGADLGLGGHLTALRRTRIGPFSVDEASALNNKLDEASALDRKLDEASALDRDLVEALVSPADAAARVLPSVKVSREVAVELAQGKRPKLDAAPGPHAIIDPDGRLVGLAESLEGRARVLVNFPPDDRADGPTDTPSDGATE